jgi:hypothetical protein
VAALWNGWGRAFIVSGREGGIGILLSALRKSKLFAVIAASLLSAAVPANASEYQPASEMPPAESSGEVYYVAPYGSDQGEGSLESPWATLTRSLKSLQPGDVLLVRGGTYRERVHARVSPASPDLPITVAAYGDETPVVKGLLWITDASHWAFEGINVTWDPDTGHRTEHMVKFTGGTGWSFTGAEVWGARSYAAVLVAARASNWRIAHNRIRNTRPTNRKNQDDLISVTALGGGGVIERNLLIRSPNGRAVGIGPRRRGAGAPRGITVRYNTMFANRGPANIEMRFGSHRNRIYRNLMVRSRPRHPNIAAYKLWGKGNLVYQNLGWRSRTVVNRRAFAVRGGNMQRRPRWGNPHSTHFVPSRGPARFYGAHAPGRLASEDPPLSVPSPPKDPASGLTLAAQAQTYYSAALSGGVPAAAETIQIHRDDRLIADFPASNGLSYVDYLLWEDTTYAYRIRALSSSGEVLAEADAEVTTPVSNGSWPRLYAPDSFWNTPIPEDAPLDPNSEEIVRRSLVEHRSLANFANNDKWGIAFAYSNAVDRNYDIACTVWHCNSQVSFRIPAYARPTTGSDLHLSVLDVRGNKELGMYRAERTANAWTAGSRYITDAAGTGANCEPGGGCGSAVAAGFGVMAGVIRPEEIARGRIDHALAITTPFTRSGFVACPATKTDGKHDDPDALPQAARVQLDPSFDVDAQSWPRWKKVIARALQEYGAYVVDTAGSVALRGEANINRGYDAWDKADTPIRPSLADLPWEDMRVLKIERC